MIWRAEAVRSSRGLSTMVKPPVLAGFGLSVLPVCEPIAWTSGSRRMIAPSSCCSRIISWGETSCEASETPEMSPVSWIGKKPLGLSMYITTVSAMVAKNTASVSRWWRSATSSVRR